MLNLEWVTKKLLPSVIERRSVTTKKKQQPLVNNLAHQSPASPALSYVSSEASPSPPKNHSHSHVDATATLSLTLSTSPSLLNSPSQSLTGAALAAKNVAEQMNNETQTNSINDEKNPFEGPCPDSVVTPQVFAAILDEALSVLKKPTVSQKRKQEQKELLLQKILEQRKILQQQQQQQNASAATSIGGATTNEKVMALNPFLREEQEQQQQILLSTIQQQQQQQNTVYDYSAPNEIFPEITLHQGFKNNKKSSTTTNHNNNNRKVYTFGPIRGHAVPLATMLFNLIN
jgi:hypothetical protein